LNKKRQEPELSNEETSQGVNEVMITLLGRLAFPPDQLIRIVMKGKRTPEDYVRGYNLCDGEHTLTQIANEVHVTHGTLSPIMSEWKDAGIIYEVVKKGGKFYKRLYKLEVPKAQKTERVVKPEDQEGASSAQTTQETQGKLPSS
jgi:hypothetical protein